MLRIARRRRLERWVVGVIVLVAVTLVLVLLGRIGLFDGGGAPAAPAQQTPGFDPVARPADPTRPFAGTPAASWPDGAAGIVPPAPIALGGFSEPQVAAALDQVRTLLVTSRLDPAIVVTHDPSRFLAAFAPDARRQLEPLFGSGREAQAQSLVSMVAADARLLPVEPKVTGRMWPEAGGAGELVVHTNYLFVYAFEAPEPSTDLMDALVVVRADVDYILRAGDSWAAGSHGWWYGRAGGYAYSIACDAYRKGFIAPVITERKTTTPSGDRAAYFNIDTPLPATSGCPR
ncbi:MAG TPA: hypothetical protein VFV67_36505 [Actinophytocola sp.]|uniref:hypothetical protein n=1 Tax=Actinophytocola sp. TaxID=1872138 RepID=UPI002DB74424|nr:hypothetical protein [Actinophytocola sp.]HEU5476159.1 hypothetical protein [Actinophytocola sp.]